MESIASMYLLELKRGLAILLIFRLPGICLFGNVPMSHPLLLYSTFLSVETASTLPYAQETTTAQLRSHSCFLIAW